MKLNYKRTALIGLCFMSISAFWTFFDQIVPYMLEFSFGTFLHKVFGPTLMGGRSETVLTNIIMTFDNLFAVFLLPLFGALSDRTHTSFGKRTPYIAFGTIASVILFIMLGISEKLKSFPLFFLCLLLLLVALSTYRSPAVALMPDLTPRALRSKGNAIINLMGTAGGAFSLLTVMLLVHMEDETGDTNIPIGGGASIPGEDIPGSETSYLPAVLVVAGFMLLTVMIFLITVKERPLSEELHRTGELSPEDSREEEDPNAGVKMTKPVRRSLFFMLFAVALWYMAYNGCTTALSRYFITVLGANLALSSSYVLVALAVATISFLPIAFLSSRFGRKKVILAGILLMALAFLGGSFLRSANFIMYIIFSAIGVGWAAINVNAYPMVIEMSRGADIGKYTGLYYTFSMAAQVLTPIVSAVFISNDQLGGYYALFPYAAICSALALVFMIFVKHGDVRPGPTGSLLEHFGAED